MTSGKLPNIRSFFTNCLRICRLRRQSCRWSDYSADCAEDFGRLCRDFESVVGDFESVEGHIMSIEEHIMSIDGHK